MKVNNPLCLLALAALSLASLTQDRSAAAGFQPSASAETQTASDSQSSSDSADDSSSTTGKKHHHKHKKHHRKPARSKQKKAAEKKSASKDKSGSTPASPTAANAKPSTPTASTTTAGQPAVKPDASVVGGTAVSLNPSAAAKSAVPASKTTPVTAGAHPILSNTGASPKPDATHQSGKTADTLFDQTKQDISATATVDRPQESPMAAMGDAWKMLIYLVPTLLVIVGALRLLRRFQERTGRLPGPLLAMTKRTAKVSPVPSKTGGLLSALMGGLHLNGPRQNAGSSIRVIESMSVGGANLHLIQVRGRMLLLGASGSDVRVLTEFREQEGVADEDFRQLLQSAAADLDSLDLDDSELTATTVVGSLESAMRDTGDAVSRRIRRLCTVKEAEESVD